MFDWLPQEVGQSAVTYPVVFAAAALDVLFPLIPSGTIIITASAALRKEALDPDLRVCFNHQTRERRWS